MASVLIKNTRQHDIVLTVATTQVTVPAGVNGPEGFAPGIATADDSFVAEAKKNEVAKLYFSEGWLLVDDGAPAPKKARTQE